MIAAVLPILFPLNHAAASLSASVCFLLPHRIMKLAVVLLAIFELHVKTTSKELPPFELFEQEKKASLHIFRKF